MEVKLNKSIKNPIIISGFPGFGLVGSIATEFLIEHLKTEKVGSISLEEAPAMIAIHEEKLIHPVSLHHDSSNNILIITGLTQLPGLEWKLGEAILDIAKETKAKEIISLEGVGSNADPETAKAFFFSNDAGIVKDLKNKKLEALKEGIVLGVTSALLLKNDSFPITAFFVEAHTAMPDSKAAAKIIELLDNYLGLKVDYEPLVKQAEVFEKKLKTLLEKGQSAMSQQEMKKLNYVG